MKKLVFAIIALAASLTASAQVYLGGSLGFQRDFNKNTTDFVILPEIGYNFNDTWAVGGTIGYLHKYENHFKTNMGEISPYARWTFFRSDNNLVSLFVDGGVGVGFGSTKYRDFDSESLCTWNIGFKPGIAIHPSKNFTVLAHVGFIGYEGADDNAKAAGFTEKFGINATSLNLNLGFYYNF